MWVLYQLGLVTALLVAAPVLAIRRGRHYLPTLRQRLGGYGATGAPAPGGIWIHAVSVGEVAVAQALLGALPKGETLVVTTVTPTGQERARAAFGGSGATVAYLPFDFGFAVRRFLDRFQPRALVLVEGDAWPLALAACRRRRMSIAVINARMSDRSAGRWRRMGSAWRRLHRSIDRFGAQTAADRNRLISLGAAPERVVMTGNLKFESPEPVRNQALDQALRLLAGPRPIVLAGSTMQGEDERVLDAFKAIGGGRRALLVLVPRHPERWDDAAALADERGFSVVRRSCLDLEGDTRSDPPDVLLLDSIGELASLYRVADIAFVGGTLVPTGGHNPLEPARFGVPVVVGPSMHNFRDMAEVFDHAEAWQRVEDGAGLVRALGSLLDDSAAAAALGARGQALIDANRGALAATRVLLEPLFLPSGGGPATEGTR